MNLSQLQEDLLFGTLLGDGNLQTGTQGKTWRYRALQKAGHMEYLFHKYEILQEFCLTAPRLSETTDKRTNRVYSRWSFNTKVHDSFTPFGNMFYTYHAQQSCASLLAQSEQTQKMVKDVPYNIEEFLTFVLKVSAMMAFVDYRQLFKTFTVLRQLLFKRTKL
jgi:hypothetical protein